MKSALITGAAGFVGSHLIELLLSKGIKVVATTHPEHSSDNLKSLRKNITTISLDLTKKGDIKKIPTDTDYFFHLAAFSSPPQSFRNPKQTLENNIFSELYLLERLAKSKSKAKVLIVGSSDEYGNVDPAYLPVNENAPLMPNSPYAVSKVAQDLLGYQFFLSSNLNIIRVRPFNHIGPRQSTHFVVPAFASQIANIEKKGSGEIIVGNLNTYRDFTDVRDMVRAYLAALDKGGPGDVYNIGSGKTYKIEDILKKLISLSPAKIKVKQNNSLIRMLDTYKIVCDFSKFRRKTGWEPEISVETTLFDTIEYERSKLH